MVKKGIAKLLPDTDLVQFVPGWCNVKSIVDECHEEREFESESDGRGRLARDIALELASREKPNTKNVLGFFQWGVAYDRCVLACVGAEVWSYATALVHK